MILEGDDHCRSMAKPYQSVNGKRKGIRAQLEGTSASTSIGPGSFLVLWCFVAFPSLCTVGTKSWACMVVKSRFAMKSQLHGFDVCPYHWYCTCVPAFADVLMYNCMVTTCMCESL